MPGSFSDSDRLALVERLADALERLHDTTCAEMVPLWVDVTRQARKELGGLENRTLGFTPSRRFLALSKGSRSKYRYLAAWRHAVLLHGALDHVDDDEFRGAVEAVYFDPYPENAPPYAWSRSGDAAPRIAEFPSASTLKNWSCEGAYQTVMRLVGVVERMQYGSWAEVHEAAFLRLGCRRTLRDVLKLEAHPRWEEP